MKRVPIGHFLPVDLPAIVQYCRLATLQQRLYLAVRDGAATKEQRAEFMAISAQVTTLCRLLRFGPSTRNNRDTATRTARDHADAYDPAAPDWKAMMKGGNA
jgi:hypothetical protein